MSSLAGSRRFGAAAVVVLVALAALLFSNPAGAQVRLWERDGLDGRQVRALVWSGGAGGMVALTGGAREPSPVWWRNESGWSQPKGDLPGFVLAVAAQPDHGVLLGTGRDVSDQPGIFLTTATPPSSRRIYDLQAIGSLVVAPGRGGMDVYAASAPWADRDAGSDLLRREAGSDTWHTILQGEIMCGQSTSYFKQVVVAPSDSRRVYALELCSTRTVRQMQLWRSDNRGRNWYTVALPQAAPTQLQAGPLAVDPSEADILYFAPEARATLVRPVLEAGSASAPVGLQRSSDGGLTWMPAGDPASAPLGVRALVVDQQRPGRLVAGTESSGVMVSEDHGETWASLPGLDVERIWALLLDATSSRIFAATSDGVWQARVP